MLSKRMDDLDLLHMCDQRCSAVSRLLVTAVAREDGTEQLYPESSKSSLGGRLLLSACFSQVIVELENLKSTCLTVGTLCIVCSKLEATLFPGGCAVHFVSSPQCHCSYCYLHFTNENSKIRSPTLYSSPHGWEHLEEATVSKRPTPASSTITSYTPRAFQGSLQLVFLKNIYLF